MDAFILAGGKGSRIKSFKKDPKPLIKINGKEIIIYIAELLKKNGVENIFILTGYKKNRFNYLTNKYKLLNLKLVPTGLNSTTGERLLKIKKLIKKNNFIFTYGNSLASFNLKKNLKIHKFKKNIITTCVYKLKDNYGVLNLNDFKIKSFDEKKIRYINAGFYIIDPSIFKYKSKIKIFEKRFLPLLARNNKLGYSIVDKWQPMDTETNYYQMKKLLSKKNYFSK